MRRFGRLWRVPYSIRDADQHAIEAGELDPATCYVSAEGVPEPEHHEGTIVGVEWKLDEPSPCVLVTFWSPM